MHWTTYLRLLQQLNVHGTAASHQMDATNVRIEKKLHSTQAQIGSLYW
jgi:hypothetical protein